MEQELSIHNLMARLRGKDDAAARQLFQRYAERLIDLAQHHLRPLMRPKMDPEDVMQSVFQSFFVRRVAGEFGDVETWESLWKVLVTLTLRKCNRRTTHFFAERRDIHREIIQAPAVDDSREDGWEAQVPDPTAAEASKLTETLEALMNRLGKDDCRGERNRQILTLRLQGSDIPEISAQLNCTERTVYRVLDRAKEILNRMQAEED